jgi:hypothetical protein
VLEVCWVRGLFGGGADCRGDDDNKVNFDVGPEVKFEGFGSWMGLTRADRGGGNLTLGVCGPPMKEGGFLLRVSGCGGRRDGGTWFVKIPFVPLYAGFSGSGRRGGDGGRGRFGVVFPLLGRLYMLGVLQFGALVPARACLSFDLLRSRNDVNRFDRRKDRDLLRRSFLADVRLRVNMEGM